MPSEWNNLRPWNGSQDGAFEELCCQLASCEKTPQGSKFIRKAPPDAGVECYWTLPNGDEWGWQAKFFLGSLQETQWRQIDESVEKALEKHPRLTKYTICLPRDLGDPLIEGQKSIKDKWNERVEKWKDWTQQKAKQVDFPYWGEHEIFQRLSLEEHRGRHLFWFNKELFSKEWLTKNIEVAVANAGPRYTPELKVELPIAQLFDGLARTPEFFKEIKELYGKMRRESSNGYLRKCEEKVKDKTIALKGSIDEVLSILEKIEEDGVSPIELEPVVKSASKARNIALDCARSLDDFERREKEAVASKAQNDKSESERYNPFESIENIRHHLYGFASLLDQISDLTVSKKAQLANTPALLIIGNAGTGKTHLFCDLALQRICSGKPTILLLGEHFKDDEPWKQVNQLLGLICSKEEFLGAFEACAQASNSRAIILIDGLNEGEGKILWHKHLAGILTSLTNYPWIGIAVSLRTSYENLIIPEGLIPDRLIREEHLGFSGQEYKATKAFFNHYGIEQPTIPLMEPEFQNPLFLKLFCKGLKNKGLTRIPTGLHGVTAIFNTFIESVNEYLWKRERLNFDPKSEIVQKAVEKISKIMADEGKMWLSRDVASEVINSFLPGRDYENSLFRHMLSEGLITEDRYPTRNGEDWCEGIHFTYERFTDHLISKRLLDKYLLSGDPTNSFLSEQPLGLFIKDEGTCWRNRGLIEAFSVQLPERIGKELVDIAPYCADFRPIREAFVDSLIWREAHAFSPNTLQYINGAVIRYDDTYNKFLDALLTIAIRPGHPYNADFLHAHLTRFELAERDAQWSIYVHHHYGEKGAVDRLVDWAWTCEDKSKVNDESIRLCGIALSWFLTTSNRYLRDRATKALVALLSNRVPILREVLKAFKNVNDPYVLERLMAVAYGCVMRTSQGSEATELGKELYEWIFKDRTPSPHILLRDYARGVIELALQKDSTLSIEPSQIRPPYKSDYPTNIPTEDELKSFGKWEKGMPDEEWSRVHLYDSVMSELGDFSRYIIGERFGSFEWSARRLGEPRRPSRKEIYEKFIENLTSRQRKTWEAYDNTRRNVEIYHRLDLEKRRELFKRDYTEYELKTAVKEIELIFKGSLRKKKLKIYMDYIKPFLDDPRQFQYEYSFDMNTAKRWILKKVIEMGWTVKRFGRFDRYLTYSGSYGRSGDKPERIGKKYQWIAYHEFLARVADNYEFRGDSWSQKQQRYQGPWQKYLRDIDPSCILKKTHKETGDAKTNTWWFDSRYNEWSQEADNDKWLRKTEDLPNVEPLIEVTNPKDSSKWLVLDGYYQWEEQAPPEEERYEKPRGQIGYIIGSYIVKKRDIEELFKWAQHQCFFGRWMPESRELDHVYLGEFYWAPAYNYQRSIYTYGNWTRGYDNRIPKVVLLTTEEYYQEGGGYDCSIESSIRIRMPCKQLIDGLKLRWNGVEGHFFDERGNLIAFDPSVQTTGPGVLVIKKDAILKYLNDNGLSILWTVVGEKYLLGGRLSQEEYLGRLVISGAYTIKKGKLEGKLNTKFQATG